MSPISWFDTHVHLDRYPVDQRAELLQRAAQAGVRHLLAVSTDRASSRVTAAAKLHRHVARKRTGQFLAEGPNLVEAALRHGSVREVFVTGSGALADVGSHLAIGRSS